MLASKYELDVTTQYWVITIFAWIRYVTLWPCPLTFWPGSHDTWCHVGDRSVFQVWTGYDLPFQSYEDYNLTFTASIKSQLLRFLGVKGVKFQM